MGEQPGEWKVRTEQVGQGRQLRPAIMGIEIVPAIPLGKGISGCGEQFAPGLKRPSPEGLVGGFRDGREPLLQCRDEGIGGHGKAKLLAIVANVCAIVFPGTELREGIAEAIGPNDVEIAVGEGREHVRNHAGLKVPPIDVRRRYVAGGQMRDQAPPTNGNPREIEEGFFGVLPWGNPYSSHNGQPVARAAGVVEQKIDRRFQAGATAGGSQREQPEQVEDRRAMTFVELPEKGREVVTGIGQMRIAIGGGSHCVPATPDRWRQTVQRSRPRADSLRLHPAAP